MIKYNCKANLMSRPSSSRLGVPQNIVANESTKGKVPQPQIMLPPQNMYLKGNQQSSVFTETQKTSANIKEKHSAKSNHGKVSASASASLENAKRLPSKYAVHPSHRFPISPHITSSSINASEGRKTLRAFSELRQSAAALYPSTSKTSVFLKQTPSTEEVSLENSSTPFIHMIMSHQADASKMKERSTVKTVLDKHPALAKVIPKRDILQQHFAFPDFYRFNDNLCDGVSTNSESTSYSSPPLSSYSSARSENELERWKNDCISDKIDDLRSALKSKNAEISTMKSDMKNLRATVEESSKEANLAKKLLQNFRVKISSLEEQMEMLEDRVGKQETEIIEHLMSKIEEDTPASSSESLVSVKVEEKEAIKPPSPHLSSTINFDKILSSIGDLNRRMDRLQSMQLIYANDKSGATFKQPKPISLALYKNGIVLGETGFRSYNVDSVKQVLIDICKGYFPSELYTQHPNGIFIDVTDKRGVVHQECDTFSGKGCKLSGSGSIPELNSLSGISSKHHISAPDITSSIESLDSLVSKKCEREIELPDILSGSSRKQIQDKIITLKLKQINNDKCYKMKVPISTTVGELLEHMAKILVLNEKSCQTEIKEQSTDIKTEVKLDLISSAPFGLLANPHSSLQEYGIQQNTLLYIAVH